MDLNKCFLVLSRRNSLVRSQSLARIGNILLGYRNIDAKIDRDAGFVGDLITTKLGYRTLEHFCVKIKSQCIKMARLLATEYVSGTS